MSPWARRRSSRNALSGPGRWLRSACVGAVRGLRWRAIAAARVWSLLPRPTPKSWRLAGFVGRVRRWVHSARCSAAPHGEPCGDWRQQASWPPCSSSHASPERPHGRRHPALPQGPRVAGHLPAPAPASWPCRNRPVSATQAGRSAPPTDQRRHAPLRPVVPRFPASPSRRFGVPRRHSVSTLRPEGRPVYASLRLGSWTRGLGASASCCSGRLGRVLPGLTGPRTG